MESKVVHFHCTHVLGALLPLKGAKNNKDAKAGAVIWLDARWAPRPNPNPNPKPNPNPNPNP